MAKPIRLNKAAAELNISSSRIVEYLSSKDIIVDNNPNTKLEGDVYEILLEEFAADSSVKQKSKVASLIRERKELVSSDYNESKSEEPSIIEQVEKLNTEHSKNKQLWDFVCFNEIWANCLTDEFDDVWPSWKTKYEELKNNVPEFEEFLEQTKRRHAIETGIVERLYDLKRGVTETLIREGFISTLVSHGDTDISKNQLMSYLRDQLDAINYTFEIVKGNRPLTKHVIRQLHEIIVRSQHDVEALDSQNKVVRTQLLKGEWKKYSNNPKREDGTVVAYCPPEHVEAEMDSLVSIYNDLVEQNTHPVIISAWFHHAFTTIHPFQDGNGRIARLLASVILIKQGLFPVTVLREETKVKYIEALENADNGQPQNLVKYFCEIQRNHILQALDIRVEKVDLPFDSLVSAFTDKLNQREFERTKAILAEFSKNRNTVFDFCRTRFASISEKLKSQSGLNVSLIFGEIDDESNNHFYHKQIVSFAKKHGYFYRRDLPSGFLKIAIPVEDKRYDIVLSIHHRGKEDKSLLCIAGFLDYRIGFDNDDLFSLPLEIRPYTISIQDLSPNVEKNIGNYVEQVFATALAQIMSEL
jgi:Fic family protein